MKLSPSATRLFKTLAEKYVAAGFPQHHNWGFAPERNDALAYNELRACGLVAPFTQAYWRLTDFGQEMIMESRQV